MEEWQGLSLEQVDELYAKESRAWRSKHFVPTISFVDVQGLDLTDARKRTLADLESVAGGGRKSPAAAAAAAHAELLVSEKC